MHRLLAALSLALVLLAQPVPVQLPDIPTFPEAGIPATGFVGWLGFVASARQRSSKAITQ